MGAVANGLSGLAAFRRGAFAPHKTTIDPREALNLWTGLAVASKPGKWPLIKAFLFEIICDSDPDASDYLLKLLQWKIQNPVLNPEIGIVLRGPPATGKGTFARMLKVIFGEKRYHRYGNRAGIGDRQQPRACVGALPQSGRGRP
jgi:hypothetical protein